MASLAGVLRNLTDRTWTVVPDGEEPQRVAPNQRLGVRPMRIDFGPARGADPLGAARLMYRGGHM